MVNFQTGKRRIKFWWRLLWAYFSKYKLYAAIFAITAIFLVFIAYRLFGFLNRSNTLTIGYVGNFTVENIPTSLLSLATGSLVTEDASGRPVPSLATNWTVAEDGKTYVFFLKDNLKWQDSTTVEAKDISIAIKGVQITALNNKAIEFKLPNPIPSFPLALDKPVFKAKSFYGTGQYRIVGIDKVKDVVKKISLVPADKSLPKVEIKFYSSQEQAIHAIEMGDVKRATVANADMLASWANLNVSKVADKNEIVTIFFNTGTEQLGTKEMRQALSYAINDSDFDGERADGPISPLSWAYDAPSKYEHNVGKAKELLAKSQVKNPKITLSVAPDLQALAEKIKGDWENIGVATEIKIEEGVPKEFQALLAVDVLKPDPDQYALWHSTQVDTNISKVNDPVAGQSEKGQYRKFKIKFADKPNDYEMLTQTLTRRFKNGWPKPDLIIIDGGRGQLNVALSVLSSAKLSIPVVSLAKRLEEIYTPQKIAPIRLPKESPARQLAQAIRDEAHRFAITYHRLLRSKNLIGNK